MPLTRRRRQEIASLARKKHRERLGQMLVEGVRSVEAATDAGAALVEIVVSEAVRNEPRVQALLDRTDVPVGVVTASEMAALSDVQTSQGVLAVAQIRRPSEVELAACRSVLALDGVQDPGNVGAVLRTAAWFGAEAVLAGPGTADFFSPKTVRAAMGGLWDVRLAQTSSLAEALGQLQEGGFHLYGANLEGTPARVWQPQPPSVLVLGSEAHGLSPDVRDLLEERVAIGGVEGRRGAESLNVAVAAGILMYRWLGR